MRKFTHTIILFLMTSAFVYGQAFITIWKTDNPGTSNDNQITIPTFGGGYNYTVDWGDGISNTGVTGEITHTYASSGIYEVSITGDFPRIFFSNGGDKEKILTIEQWGNTIWDDMGSAFWGCINLTSNANDTPNLANVTSTNSMFRDASSFNTDIGSWDVSSVTSMVFMFNGATSFNQPLNSWDVSNVLDMRGMFRGATSFNQDLTGWDVPNVTDMSLMFFQAIAFNGNIANWDVSEVGNMNGMFFSATAFDQDLSNWDVSSVFNMSDMLDLSGLSTANYDKILTGWSQLTLLNSVAFGADGLEYCLGAADRQSIIDNYSWVITDNGENCVVNIPDANFKAALLANAAINTLDDGEITFDEAEAFSGTIDVSNQSISDLTGIEAFENLTELNANDNLLTEIDISNNTMLTKVYLANNQFATLDVSFNTVLNTLTVQNNSLSILDISNTNMDILESANNDLTSIVIGSAPLRFLRANGNSIQSMDLSGFANIEFVDLRSNGITNLNIANGNNSNFIGIKLSSNPDLTCVTVDDPGFSEANWRVVTTTVSIDATTSFSTDCSNVANDITAFSFTEQSSPATIGSGVVDIEVTLGTDLSNLTPTFTISAGATVDPASGLAQDFSNAFVYSVTAENPTEVQNWTINVQEENVAPTDIILDNSSIDENNVVGSVIGELSSTDANTNDSHSYSLVTGIRDTDNASFSISGDQLLSAETFDFEAKSSYTVRIQTDDGRGGTFEKEFAISVNDLDGAAHSITFDALAASNVGDPNFELTATASSGLVVSYSSSNTAVATVSGSTVTIVGAGTTDLTASQAGNEDYAAATNVIQSLTVNKIDQTITFGTLESVTFGDAEFNLTASTDSGLDITYTSSDENVAMVSGATVTIVGAGTVDITAFQAGNDSYNVATSVTQSLVVNKADQTITLDAIADKDVSDAPFEVTVSASSGLDVSLSVSGPATVTGTAITLDGTEGTVTITASQAGNDNYNAAADASTSFEVATSLASQTITFAAIEDQFIEAGSLTLSATASSGLEVSFSIVSGPAVLSGNELTFTDLGTILVSANQAGNTEFLPAESIEQSFEVITVTSIDNDASTLLIYPNPASDVLTIQTSIEEVKIYLLDIRGANVMNIIPNYENDISHLDNGIYFLRIINSHSTTIHKIIKQ